MKVTCSRPLLSVGPEKACPGREAGLEKKERKGDVRFCAYILSVLHQSASLVFHFGCSFLLGRAAPQRPERSVLGVDTGCCPLAVATAAWL